MGGVNSGAQMTAPLAAASLVLSCGVPNLYRLHPIIGTQNPGLYTSCASGFHIMKGKLHSAGPRTVLSLQMLIDWDKTHFASQNTVTTAQPSAAFIQLSVGPLHSSPEPWVSLPPQTCNFSIFVLRLRYTVTKSETEINQFMINKR